ncbi:MAG: hypothetical protein ACTTKL_02870 [Treponema sp.]
MTTAKNVRLLFTLAGISAIMIAFSCRMSKTPDAIDDYINHDFKQSGGRQQRNTSER